MRLLRARFPLRRRAVLTPRLCGSGPVFRGPLRRGPRWRRGNVPLLRRRLVPCLRCRLTLFGWARPVVRARLRCARPIRSIVDPDIRPRLVRLWVHLGLLGLLRLVRPVLRLTWPVLRLVRPVLLLIGTVLRLVRSARTWNVPHPPIVVVRRIGRTIVFHIRTVRYRRGRAVYVFRTIVPSIVLDILIPRGVLPTRCVLLMLRWHRSWLRSIVPLASRPWNVRCRPILLIVHIRVPTPVAEHRRIATVIRAIAAIVR